MKFRVATFLFLLRVKLWWNRLWHVRTIIVIPLPAGSTCTERLRIDVPRE